jgi:HSP20 family molecular chaperone IbpA
MKKTDRKKSDEEDKESIVENTVNDLMPGMGNLVKNLRKTSPELNSKIEETEAEIRKRLEEGYSPEPKVTYGVKVRTLSHDNRPEKEKRPENETIEPLTDVFDEDSRLRIVAEMPGIPEEKIKITHRGSKLSIFASDAGKKYKKEIAVPWKGTIVKKRYQNGILEIILERNDT